MTATKETRSRDRLTLRDSVDLYALINQWVEDNIDEVEFNEGALPDDLARLLDEVDASVAERVDGFAFKVDEFIGKAATAKATKDRAARREKVYANIIKSMKAYGFAQVQRNNGEPLKGITASLRIQRNGGNASVECSLTQEQLLDATDCHLVGPAISEHPLGQFLTATVEVTLNKELLAYHYEARAAVLASEARLIGESDIEAEFTDPDDAARAALATPEEIERLLEQMRRVYVTAALATEFPGITCTRGSHLRID